jgi:hypothetical protein
VNDKRPSLRVIALRVALAAVAAFCGGCTFLHPVTQHVLDCQSELKLDHSIGWGFSDTWVAECQGVTYDCDLGAGVVDCRPRGGDGTARGMVLPPPPPRPYVPPPR